MRSCIYAHAYTRMRMLMDFYSRLQISCDLNEDGQVEYAEFASLGAEIVQMMRLSQISQQEQVRPAKSRADVLILIPILAPMLLTIRRA